MVNEADDVLIGVTLGGRYEVRAALGQGGMGAVYEARDHKLDRRVAIKTVLPQLAADPRALERFDQERRILAKLEHAHIIDVIDIGAQRVGDRDIAYLVMPYLGGGTLRERLADGPLSYAEAASILRNVCQALDDAHALRIFHRDIKPENILFSERDDVVRVSDFGLVKVLADVGAAQGTATILGTRGYGAYEQWQGGPVSAATDVYALGVVLHEMLTGHRPEGGLHAIVDPALPAAVAAPIARAIAADPDARYQTAGGLADAYGAAYEKLKREGVIVAVEPGQLEAAVVAAAAGATLQLAPGDYRLAHALMVDKPLTLRGAGINRTRVVGENEHTVLRYVGDGRFAAQALEFRREGAPWGFVVGVESGEIALNRCRFTGGVRDEESKQGGSGLVLGGDTRGFVRRCDATRNAANGIEVAERACIAVERTICRANKWNGIVYIGHSSGLVHADTCEGNAERGIYVGGHATPTLKDNVCADNGVYGIILVGHAQPTLEHNTCRANKQSGIGYLEESGGIARTNTCEGNVVSGIVLVGHARPTLEGNTCRANKVHGISYYEESGGVARSNTCEGNALDGVAVTNQAAPTLKGNVCADNEWHGIDLAGQARPTLEGNICRANKQHGIGYFEESEGVARANICEGNAGDGIFIGTLIPQLVLNNTCTGNGHYGINVAASPHSQMDGNNCSGNGTGLSSISS